MISIIIPVYNKSEYIETTLNSLKNQSFNEWECIIIDDNSSDSSLDKIHSYLQSDLRFKIIKNDVNRGACYCRNQGIKLAKGKYIMFLDADDYISNNCLKNRVSKFKELTDFDFLVFPSGTFKKSIGDSSMIWNNFKGNHLNRFLAHDLPWVICSVIWQKSFLKQIQGFDETFPRLQDVELHVKALKCNNINYTVFSESNPDSFYRIDRNRISDKFDFLMKDIDGKILFLLKMNREFPNNKFLKGTYFESLVNVSFFYKRNEINKKEYNQLLDMVLENEFGSKLGFYDFLILKIYIILGYFKIYFKGMNKLFKTLLIR